MNNINALLEEVDFINPSLLSQQSDLFRHDHKDDPP